MAKLSIAIIIPGGMGTGKDNIGVPALEKTINLLARDFNITVFQLYKINADYQNKDLEMIEVYSSNRFLRNLKFFFIFRKLHSIRRFSVVHGYWALPGGLLAVLSAKLYGLKSIISLQGGDAADLPDIRYGQMQQPLQKQMILWALHRCNILISPTRYLVDKLQGHGLKRRDVRFVPLGTDLTKFAYREKEINSPVRFLNIGNLNRVKDQATLLRAFAIIADVLPSQLTIIGEGYLEHQLKELTSGLGLTSRVIFEKLLAHEDLPSRYHMADVLLHTSRSEGHPIVVEEAMSCGVLVCGTRVGLLFDLPQCCVSVDVGDHTSLAHAVLAVVSDKVRVPAIKQSAYQWVKAHSITWTTAEIRAIYTHLATNNET